MLPYTVCRSTGIQYFIDHISTSSHSSPGTACIFFSAEMTIWWAKNRSLVKNPSIMHISGLQACLNALCSITIINNPPMSAAPKDSNLTAFFIWMCYGSIMLTSSLASASIFNHGIWPCCCSSSASASCQSVGLQKGIRALTAAVEIDVLVQLPTSPRPSVEWLLHKALTTGPLFFHIMLISPSNNYFFQP